MCVGISIALTFLIGYYTYATLTDFSLVEVVNEQTVILATGTDMVEFIWPLYLLGMVSGVLLMFVWMKFKKMI